MRQYWFTANKSGPGWTPASWQGKLLFTAFCVSVLAAIVGGTIWLDYIGLLALSLLALAIKFKGEPHEYYRTLWARKAEYRKKNAKHWWQKLP